MLKKQHIVLLAILILLQTGRAFSQTDTAFVKRDTIPAGTDTAWMVPDTPQIHHIAVFIPLYLDSAFDARGNYRFGQNFPKYISPGLEFWEGAQMAIDTLEKEGVKAVVHVYDTRSKEKFVTTITKPEMREMDLIIGHVTLNEAALLARVASMLQVPFINTNFPNDANVKNNPNFVILNPTLYTHCEGIYKFLQKNFSLSRITVFTRKGAQEDRLKQYLAEVEKNTASVSLKLKYVTLPANFTEAQLLPYLDSNTTNVCMSGSLDVGFAQRLCQQLAGLSESYATTVMGMPTWDVIDFSKPQFKGIEIYYSSPFYIDTASYLVNNVYESFKNDFYSRPSDMVFRGFESLYHFIHLLDTHNKNIGSSLGDKQDTLFYEFNIQPVLDRQTMTLDYFENKKLYFIRKTDGIVKAVY